MDKRRLSSFLLMGVPPISVIVVGVVLFVAGSPRPFPFARVFGGPTDGAGPWTGRVQLLTRSGDVDEPLAHAPLRVEWSDRGSSTSFVSRTDDEGWAEVRLERPRAQSRLDLSVYGGELQTLVARGAPELPAERWRRAARRRSGVLQSRSEGALSLAVRVSGGVLSVPFASTIEIEARDGHGPLRGAVITTTTEGLDVASRVSLVTDERGRAELVVRPREHVVSLALELRAEHERAEVRWFGHLPVVAGALHVGVQEGALVIESPVARESAWYALVSQSERLAGGRVALAPDGRGGALGRVSLSEARIPAPPRDDLWLVVSGDADGRSPSTLGWPWGKQGSTFDAVDALLLDGSRFGAERELSRRRRLRAVVGAYALAACALTLFLLVSRVRRENSDLVEQLNEVGAGEAAPTPRSLAFGLVVAGFCVLLGFLVVLLVSLLRAS